MVKRAARGYSAEGLTRSEIADNALSRIRVGTIWDKKAALWALRTFRALSHTFRALSHPARLGGWGHD